MANSDAAFGFRPVNRSGSPYNAATLRCAIPASDGTATFVGDAVKLHGSGSSDSEGSFPTVIQCAAGDPVFGVVVSFEADPATSLEDQYRKASTLRYCQVVPASEAYFEVQADDDTSTLAATSIGLNANFIVAAGSTVTGMSGMELDSNTAATTATLDLQIVGMIPRPDNEVGVANQKVLVRFNDPQDKPGRTGV